MSKLVKAILNLKSDIEGDWSQALEELNILQDIQPIYKLPIVDKVKNTILSFIILAYDNDSHWIELHKDRLDNKIKIMKRLGSNADEEPFHSVIYGTHTQTQELVSWLMIYQRDWRWDSAMAYFDYHAEIMKFSGVRTPDKEQVSNKEGQLVNEDIDIDKIVAANIKKGELIKKAIEMRLLGEAILKELQKEYVTVDTALEKEGRTKLTETVDIMKWEHAVRSWSSSNPK